MTKYVLIVLLLVLCLPVVAGDLDLHPQKMQVSGVVGTMGLGGAAYWPVVHAYGASVGPMIALGTEAFAAGGGLQIDISLDFPALDQINFGWAGYGYNWVVDGWGWEFGVGKSWEVP